MGYYGVVEVCRGTQGTNLRFLGDVVGHRDVVEVYRGQHSFFEGCLGHWESMSWGTAVSWKYV